MQGCAFLKMFLITNLIIAIFQIVHCQQYPTQERITDASESILQLINDNEDPDNRGSYPFIGGLVRLAFHDCVGEGGCDGCVNHTLPDNAGLKHYTDALDNIYDSTYVNDMSRADFYMLASVVALEAATSDAATDSDKFTGRTGLKMGRQSCVTSPEENSLNVLPSGLLNIDGVLDFFKDEFDFDAQQVVALMGAHTLGRAREEDGGFEGRWVRRPNRGGGFLKPSSFLNNEYYKTFIDRPRWNQHAKTVNGVTRMQWQGLVEATNDISTRGNTDQPNMLLNSDFCFLWNYTVVDDIGSIDCNICFQGPQCCPKSSTESIAEFYSKDENNAAWLVDFTDVFLKMVNRNTNDEMKLISELSVSKDAINQNVDEIEEILNDIMSHD